MCLCLCQWPGTALAAGKRACMAICMRMEKKGCAFTPGKNPSCSAGRNASPKARNLSCPLRNEHHSHLLGFNKRTPHAFRGCHRLCRPSPLPLHMLTDDQRDLIKTTACLLETGG